MTNPPPLSEAARALLLEHGRTLAPPHDGANVLAALRSQLAAAPAAAPRPRRAAWWTVVGGTSSIVAAWLLSGPTDGEPPTPAPAAAATVDEPVAAAPRVEPRPAPAAPATIEARPIAAPEPAPSEPHAPPPIRRSRATTPRAEPLGVTAERDHGGLADELALLGEARGALARGELSRAATALDTHARRYPTGRLQAERTAMTVMLACVEGRPDAHSKAQAYLRGPASAPYRAAVRSRCDLATDQ